MTAGFVGPWAASNRFIFTAQNASGRHNPLQKCRDPVPRVERRDKERRRSVFPLLGRPLGPAEAPKRSFENPRWPRDTVEMQGIELVAIFSLLSSLFSLFSAPSSLLSSALDSRNRIPAFLQGIMRPRGLPPCRNAAIRDGPGAIKPCCQSIW